MSGWLELRHLRSLKAIRETGSLVAAAERLHLTQSALSHQIKALETQVGAELFFRRTRPLRLAPAGQMLLELADRILPEVETVEQRLGNLAAGEGGRLHLAIECHSCYQWLLPTMERYREHWPEVEMDLSMGFSFHPLPALVRGDIDMVITSDPDPDLTGIHYAPLFRHEVQLAVPAESPLADRAHLEPEDLIDQTLITYPVCRSRLDVFTRFLDPAGVEPAAVRTSELSVMIAQLVASRRGVTAMPSWALDEHLSRGQIRVCRLGADGLWSTLYAAMREEEAGLPYLTAFVAAARQLTGERLRGIRPVAEGATAAG
ncbi:LysR family transcriptional regulator [Arhodomonas sp. AD133]|uniref:LysR family transcriptional regulator n=1 Tax=Arhodomonas sp. AD133 TaxID=3415009 RepID=UPI003EBD942C